MYYGEYFDWLCDLINLRPGTYDILIHELYITEFRYVLELDFNRAEDGKILRGDFHNGGYDDAIEDLESKPCSVLEALIGLAKHMNYILDDEDRGDRTRIWFWEMIGNLHLDEFTDASFGNSGTQDWGRLNEIQNICDTWLDRTFCHNGFGSPFPLFKPRRDQLTLHMIGQLNDYIMERHMVDDELM